MKKTLIATLLLLFSFSYSQNLTCGTKGYIAHSENFNRPSIPGPVDLDETKPYVLNAYFTLVQDSLGHTLIDNTHQLDNSEQIENKFLDCIRILNKRFNLYHIYFKYTGFQVVKTNNFNSNSTHGTWENLATYKQPNTMNFYFANYINTLAGSDQTVSAAILGGTESAYLCYALDSNPFNHEYLDRSLVHQVGHNLSLYHAFETGSHLLASDPNFLNSFCEHVTRDENDPLYNADYAGDEVADTPAQRDIDESLFPLDCSPITPTGTNCYNESYLNNVVKNYMNIHNITFDTTCPWNFTAGQVVRMRSYIKNNTTNYGYLLGTESARTDVAVLYEPFDAQVITGDVVTTVDQPENGGALVCRKQKYRLRFQPGFKQVFYDVNNGPITQSEDQQFNYENVFDHSIGVEIPSISNQVVGGVGVISSITNLSCSLESYVSGTVYSMAVLGSMNITVKELNEIEAKDPELYNSLMEKYYYILKKITTSGAKTEQSFYKN